jgi:hypothetical protein
MHMSVTHIANGETQGLAGPYEASPLRPAGVTQEPVILVFSQRPAARKSPADESDLDEGVSSLGSLSVCLVSEWSRPRMKMLPSPGGRGDGSA